MKLIVADTSEAVVAELGPLEKITVEFPQRDDDDGIYISGDGSTLARNDGVNPGIWVEGASSEHTSGSMGLIDVGSITVSA